MCTRFLSAAGPLEDNLIMMNSFGLHKNGPYWNCCCQIWLGLLLCVCGASLLQVKIDSYKIMKLQKISPAVDANLCNYRKKETETREISRQTYVIFIKQTISSALCSATERALPVAAHRQKDFSQASDMIPWVFFSPGSALRYRTICLPW